MTINEKLTRAVELANLGVETYEDIFTLTRAITQERAVGAAAASLEPATDKPAQQPQIVQPPQDVPARRGKKKSPPAAPDEKLESNVAETTTAPVAPPPRDAVDEVMSDLEDLDT